MTSVEPSENGISYGFTKLSKHIYIVYCILETKDWHGVAEKVLPAYSEHRHPDAVAICDLALYNYVEVSTS